MRKVWLVPLLTVLLFALSTPAADAHNSWDVQDDCTAGDDPNTPYFYATGPVVFWHVDTAAGHGGCHMWTTTSSSTTTPTNTASWYLPLSTTYSGDYYVDEYIVCDSHATSKNVGYWRFRDGTAAGITEGYRKNQAPLCNSYMRITSNGQSNTFDNFHGDKGAYMTIIDATGEVGERITVDLLKYIPKH
jgi:hypothetical protein